MVNEDVKKKRSEFMTYLLIILLVVTFVGSLYQSYNYGLYNGMKEICGDLDVGIDSEYNFVCYDSNTNFPVTYNSKEVFINVGP